MSALDELMDLVATLRAPDGCPWDRAQTPATMRRYVLEEAHEVVEAIDHGSDEELAKELGDLIFLVALLARMAEERGAFTLDEVVRTVVAKMIHRHPHVFADESVDDLDAAARMARWEALKALERPADASALDGVPRALPALLRAHQIGRKAAAVGFDWPDATGPRRKLDEEIGELDEAIAEGDPTAIEHELGDVLFTLANLGRHLPVPSAEDALRTTVDRFERRFRHMERLGRERDIALRGSSADTLEDLWDEAKTLEGS